MQGKKRAGKKRAKAEEPTIWEKIVRW